MPIEMMKEELLTLREAAKRLPRTSRGKTIHASAIYRWVSVGLRDIRLEVLWIGGRMLTSQQALQRFADRLTAAVERDAAVSTTPHDVHGAAARRALLDRELTRRLPPAKDRST
jgi:glycerol kinase